MLRKKIMIIVGALVLSLTTINGNGTFLEILRPIEVQAAITGLQTPTGTITGKISLNDNIPNNATLEQLKSMSVSVNPTDNPELFHMDTVGNRIRLSLPGMYLTDTIYHYSFYDSKYNEQVDEFIKILKIENTDSQGYINKIYTTALFINGYGYTERNIPGRIQDYKAYNYILNENIAKPPVKPPVEDLKKEYTTTRLGGLDRYDTAIRIANEFSTNKVETIIVASSTDFPDALSGSVLSAKYDAPILLVGKNRDNNTKIINQIKNTLVPNGKVYILGSQGAVTSDVEIMLKEQGIKNIKRLGGINRYETSINIMNEMNVNKGTPVIIANSLVYADSLSISSIAGVKGMPILLTSNSLDSNTREAIARVNPSEIYIVGGTGAVSTSVENDLRKYGKVTRIGGIDRYETSINVAKHFNLNTKTATVAYGLDFPDALSGSALAAKNNSPILLVNKHDVTRQKAYLDSTKIDKLYLLGGTGVISDKIANELKK